ncbi:MAG: hypothetical protein U5M23_13340 [Marinagarivorans sp.]|nr:hypothetical protein [Marinagarivorans sp.]
MAVGECCSFVVINYAFYKFQCEKAWAGCTLDYQAGGFKIEYLTVSQAAK